MKDDYEGWCHPDDVGPKFNRFGPQPKRFKGGKQKPTAAQKESVSIAMETLADYEKNVKPFVGKYIKRVMEDKTDRNLGLAAAATDTTRAFGDAANKVTAGNTAAGARLGSGRSTLGMAKTATAQGASGAQTAVDVNQVADDNRVRGMLDLVNFGEGKATDATRGLQDVASLSANQAAFDAQQQIADQAGGLEAATTAATLGAQAYRKRKPGLQPMSPAAYTPVQVPDNMAVMPTVG